MMKKEKKSNAVQLLIRLVVKDPDGKVLSDTGHKQAKSFVIQFLEYLYAVFDGPANLAATNTVGGETNIYGGVTPGFNYTIDAIASEITYGIVIGTGVTAESNTDFRLAARIAHGTGAGQMQYGAMDVTDTPSVVVANVDWEVNRTFTNVSGGAITVTETGIYQRHSGAYHCIIRDVLPASVEVIDGCSLIVFYTFRTTV